MLGIKVVPADVWTGIAGFLGAVISLQFMGPMSWKERMALLGSGIVAAQTLTPMLAALAVLAGWETADDFMPSIGLVIGIFCMSLVKALLRLVIAFSADPRAWVRLILTRGQSS